jgi:hypothetical protein
VDSSRPKAHHCCRCECDQGDLLAERARLRRRLAAVEARIAAADAFAACYVPRPPRPGDPGWSGYLAALSAELGSLDAAYQAVEDQQARQAA